MCAMKIECKKKLNDSYSGVIEMVDQILITKCDGELVQAARNTQYEYTTALRLLRPKNMNWTPKVMLCSALNREGVHAVWENIQLFWNTMRVIDVLFLLSRPFSHSVRCSHMRTLS
jgi:putative protein kinase ArgK-like GTPase of G3E family